MSRHMPVVALLASCLLAVAGCSGSTSRPASSAPSVTDPVGALVLTAAPAGFRLSTVAGSNTGATDLAKAVHDDAQPDARAALTAEGFQHGYQRLWTGFGGDVVGLQVYRFAGARGAHAYVARADRIARAQAQHVATFAVGTAARAAGARGSTAAAARGYEVDVEGNRTEQIVGASGRLVMQLICTSRTATDLRARAITLAQAQLAKLSSGS